MELTNIPWNGKLLMCYFCLWRRHDSESSDSDGGSHVKDMMKRLELAKQRSLEERRKEKEQLKGKNRVPIKQTKSLVQ